MEILAVIFFFLVLALLLKGAPVSITLGGVSVIYIILLSVLFPNNIDTDFFSLLPLRIKGIMDNYVLIAIPLFVFMGITLQKSGLASKLLTSMASLFGGLKGGVPVSVIIVGTLLAASTGIVGATVVTMGLISLPTLLEKGYKPSFSSGIIISSGTLGQIIPPSIVLILLADTISSSSRSSQVVDVGSLFQAALVPGLLLVGLYILYAIIGAYSFGQKTDLKIEEVAREKVNILELINVLVLPLILILVVLGSIFFGIASPTEASALGALGAVVLVSLRRKFSLKLLKEVSHETMLLTAMVFWILLGATTFALVFRELGGDTYLENLIISSNISPAMFLILCMLFLFIAGFFIDFFEIIFIFVPIIVPIFEIYEFDLIWIGILIALNLQTSFLSPPFGFSLFYLKGVANDMVSTNEIYRGVIPFILIQLFVLLMIILFPKIIYLI